MRKFIVVCLLASFTLNLVSSVPARAWNMPIEAPPVIDDPAYMFPAFSNGERLLGKNEINDLPALGWNSWHAYGSGIKEESIKETTDAFLRLGLNDAGYEYIVMDDGCYTDTRNAEGKLTNNAKFPKGFKDLADYIHERGLKFGMYNDVGEKTCAGQAGLYGNEDVDAESFAEWDVDYLKIDFCHYPWVSGGYAHDSHSEWPQSKAPRVRSISLQGNGFDQTLSAIDDGILAGRARKNTGSRYVDNLDVIGFDGGANSLTSNYWGELQFKIDAPVAGEYNLLVEYAGGTTNGRWLQVAVGSMESETRYFDDLLPSTGNNTTYMNSDPIQVKLEAGENVIRLMNYRRQENALQSYSGLYDGLKKAGVADKVKLSICEWGVNNPWYWGYKVGDSWRIANDVTFSTGTNASAVWSNGGTNSIMGQYNIAVVLDEHAGRTKGWNDPDMMCVGMIDGDTNQRFTKKVDISHFTLWCMMNSPIMLGLNLTQVENGSSVHEVITNTDALALHQDPLGVQAKRIYTSGKDGDPAAVNTSVAGRIDVLAKPLANGDFALTFLNTGDDDVDREATVDMNLVMEKIGHKMADNSVAENANLFAIEDIWTKEKSYNTDGTFSATVEPQETKTIRVTPVNGAKAVLEATDEGKINAAYTIVNDTTTTKKAKLIMAEYDASGVLKNIKEKTVSVSDLVLEDELEMNAPTQVGGMMKAFVWEDSTDIPLCDAAEYPFESTSELTTATITNSNTKVTDATGIKDFSWNDNPESKAYFSDMDGHWAEKYANLLAHNGIISDAADGQFHPEKPITQSEFIQMILESCFGKIEPSEEYWASGYLKTAFEKGIIPDINFTNAETSLSRKTAAQISHDTLLNIFGETDEQNTSVAEELADLYSCRTCVMHIAQLYTKGIINAKSDGLFHGDDNLTRAEAATIIVKMLDSSFRDLRTGKTSALETSAEDMISPEDAKKMIESDKTAILIDVRTKEEYSTGYIPGSTCVPLLELMDDISKTNIPSNKDTVIIAYCQKGSRSQKAIDLLKKAGYLNVYNVGGIEDWPYEIN